MNKYQRALKGLKQGRTWIQVGKILSEGYRDTNHAEGIVWPADAWSVYEGRSNSIKVETALQNLGLVSVPGPRWRRCIEFPDEATMLEFEAFYEIGKRQTVTEWAMGHWEIDYEHHLDMKDIYREVEGYR